ncbi:MAG: Ig-like domain-containing protein, partial [Candidatus Margulisiibacteriota bacterium]
TVEAAPVTDMTIAPATLSYSATAGSAPSSNTTTVTNNGTATLTSLTSSTTYISGSGWLTVTIPAGTVVSGATKTVTVAPSSLTTAGTYRANVTFTGTSGSGTTTEVLSVVYTVEAVADITAPTAPTSVLVTPTGWSTIDSFDITWTNPSDASGIAGYYYKLDSVPTSNTDGTYVVSSTGALNDLAVGSDGTHTAYIWLKDGSGNVNYVNHASATISLDTTAPACGAITAPSSPTGDSTPTYAWAAGSDATSGVAGYYYLHNTSSSTSNTTVRSTGTYTTGLTATPTVTSSGTYYLHVVCVDTAGNVSAVQHSSAVVIDLSGPTISGTMPTSGSTGVALTSSVIITFSETMETSTVSITSSPDPGSWSAAWSLGNTRVTYTHTAFGYNTTYTIAVAASAQDVFGNAISGDRDFTFTTSVETVTTTPAISGISPDEAAIGTSITISGSDFGDSAGLSQVIFDDGAHTAAVDADDCTYWSDGTITLLVPTGLESKSYGVKVYRRDSTMVTGAYSNSYSFTVIAMSTTLKAYPNPFNPYADTLKMQVSVTADTRVGVYIYDIAARLVYKTEATLSTGTTNIEWDGKLFTGQLAGDGTYLIRIIDEGAKTLISKGKVIVVKQR